MWRGIQKRAARWQRRFRRALGTLDEAAILAALRKFGPCPVDALFVHSSLSACGQIRGGAPMVVGALRHWLPCGSILMPTHTYCYPDVHGNVPVFDPVETASKVGAITDWFWRQPGVVRSLHPTHSLAAQGPLANELCAGHELCETPCGRGTPYERLVQRDGSVLMFGATMLTYTLFHTAEDAAQVPYLYEPKPYMLYVKNHPAIKMWRQDMNVQRRFAAMDTVLEAEGHLKRQRLGLGELLYIPHAGRLHTWLVKQLRQNPNLLVAQ